MKPRHAFVVVFVAATALSLGRYSALAVLLGIGMPVLWLGKGMDKMGGAARRRASMTEVAGPSRFYPCTYCGRPGESWDHVMPWSRGGGDGPDNRVPACTSCNSSKGDDTPEEWWARVGRGAPLPAHWPRTGVVK
jgi:hypothetical protein